MADDEAAVVVREVTDIGERETVCADLDGFGEDVDSGVVGAADGAAVGVEEDLAVAGVGGGEVEVAAETEDERVAEEGFVGVGGAEDPVRV